jgi:CheY-like chemotaxis protein
MTDLLQRSLGPLIHIETRFPFHLNRVVVDANQLELALLNLLVNARDAMPGGGTVVISAREEKLGAECGLPEGVYLCLSVKDEGQGMDAETLSRATEPFFTTKGVGKGTGLGLSMVQGLAQQSGGTLVLKSEGGTGTVAEIWLPTIDDADERWKAQAAELAPEAATHEARSFSVLAVDDDHLVLMNTVAMLEELGHRVRGASSAREAMEVLRDDAGIDLVVSDMAMPQMTGAQLVDCLKRERPWLPVILATGYAEIPPTLDPRTPRLAKPFRLADLARVIDETMHGASRPPGAPEA